MSNKTLIICSLAVMISAACHKTMPIAAKAVPAAPTPAAAPVARQTVVPTRPVPRPQPVQARATPPAGMTAQERETLNQSLARLSDALFDYDKTSIRPDALQALSTDAGVVKHILSSYPNQKLIVVGGADERGSDEYNLALGDRRAHAAEGFLVNMGIPDSQLTVVSYGKDRPVCDEHNESCWQKNRRAHITAAP